MSQDEPTTVLDLPQLYTRPSAAELTSTLELLTLKPPSWDQEQGRTQINEDGVPKYLTAIVASRLGWIAKEEREAVWESASKRLCERSGRTGERKTPFLSYYRRRHRRLTQEKATPSASRTFLIPDPSKAVPIAITLHEPSLTADNLGHKTWLASYLLAKRLPHLLAFLPPLRSPLRTQAPPARILELGAGTGLLGIAAALLFPTATTHLTDLPAILPNLQSNISTNMPPRPNNPNPTCGPLDWSHAHPPRPDNPLFNIILAADPLYSPQHPAWLARTITHFLSRDPDARAVVELPLREVYAAELDGFWAEMRSAGLVLVEWGEETGREDWGDGGEVRCWWGVWRWG